MREIKFRAWIKCAEVMINESDFYDFTMVSNGDGFGIIDRAENGDWLPKDQFEIMQYTGLKDKNGKEIYKWDFIKSSCGDVMLVVWREDLASFALRKDCWMYDHYFGEAVDAGHTEVIGNLYEHPELIKDTA